MLAPYNNDCIGSHLEIESRQRQPLIRVRVQHDLMSSRRALWPMLQTDLASRRYRLSSPILFRWVHFSMVLSTLTTVYPTSEIAKILVGHPGPATILSYDPAASDPARLKASTTNTQLHQIRQLSSPVALYIMTNISQYAVKNQSRPETPFCKPAHICCLADVYLHARI